MALQIKNSATSVLASIAKSMKYDFFKYSEKSWAVVKKYMTYKHSKIIRNNMMILVSHMITSCNKN